MALFFCLAEEWGTPKTTMDDTNMTPDMDAPVMDVPATDAPAMPEGEAAA